MARAAARTSAAGGGRGGPESGTGEGDATKLSLIGCDGMGTPVAVCRLGDLPLGGSPPSQSANIGLVTAAQSPPKAMAFSQ